MLGGEGGYDRGRVPCFAPEVVLSNCIPCARWWGELVVIGPRVALRAREQIRQECKKPSTTSVQDRVEHRSLLVQDISVVGVFASLSNVLKKLSRNLGPQLFCVRNSFFFFWRRFQLCYLVFFSKLICLCLKNHSKKIYGEWRWSSTPSPQH